MSSRPLRRNPYLLAAMAALVAVTSMTAASADPAGEGSRFRSAVTSSGGVVSSLSTQSARAGIGILDAGGNAIDAAVATVFAVGVTRPEFCGIGGGGFLVYRGADGEVASLDFRETYPLASGPDTFFIPGMHRDGTTGLEGAAGHMAVGVPGTVAGMAAALERHGSGRFSLAEVIAPAERLAREGMTVSQQFAALSTLFHQRLSYYEETRSIYLLGGATPYPPGSTLVQADYARSLALVAAFGPEAFYADAEYPAFDYNGYRYEAGPSIGRLIVRDMEGAEEAARTNPVIVAQWGPEPNDIGLLTTEDFSTYRAIWREPLTGTYRGHEVISMPPPTSGGVQTIEMLNILEGFPLGSPGWEHSSANHLHAMAEVQKIAWADRNAHIGDPDFVDVPVEQLTGKGYANKRRAEIGFGEDSARLYEAGEFEDEEPHGEASGSGGGHTLHVSVVDAAGNAVSVTCSTGFAFGSAVVAPGTGFTLNSSIIMPGPPGSPDEAQAGKRSESRTTPAIVARHGVPVLVTGGGGSSTIPRGVVQNIVNVVDFGMDIAQGIDAARVDAVVADDGDTEALELSIEAHDPRDPGIQHPPGSAPRISEEVQRELERRGHTLVHRGEYDFQPHLASAGVDQITGRRLAVSDPREEWGSCAQADVPPTTCP
ncbi:MAG: gamma-glutamyltransferase family protein [Actinobacteria bacterium]|nr:gamma-glutamyltransferase family protein [Actinomycetota bacterium]